MNRKDFGLWGLQLSPADFARALAALGVFQNSVKDWPSELTVAVIRKALTNAAKQMGGLIPWRLSIDDVTQINRISSDSADLFAKAWISFIEKRKGTLRFELRVDELGDYQWLAEKLLSSAEKTLDVDDAQRTPLIPRASLYVRADDPPVVVGWNWPLRVGFMNDADSRLLRQQVSKELEASSLKHLVTFIEVLTENDECDILLFPQDLRGVLSELLKVKWRPRADCVLGLGGGQDLTERLTSLVHAVRVETSTAGVGVLSVPDEKRGEWLKKLITVLSHDQPLDVALSQAQAELALPPPLLASSANLIDLSMVSKTASRVSQDLRRRIVNRTLHEKQRQEMASESAADDSDVASRSPFPAKKASRPWNPKTNWTTMFRKTIINEDDPQLTSDLLRSAKVAGKLEDIRGFSQETGGATDVVNLNKTAEKLKEKLPLTPEDRLIQAQVFEQPANKQCRAALLQNTSYRVDVRIGTADARWETAGKSFPVELLPPSDRGHDLVVVFTEPTVSSEPQIDTIFLPPQGASGTCRFFFQATSLRPIAARISVLHRNRVIQTAILEAPVVASGEAQTGEIKVGIEARVLGVLDSLSERQSFDTALIFNHADDGRALATGVSGNQAVMFSLDESGLNQTIQALNSELTNIADDPESFSGDIADEATTKLLITLAVHGRMLYKNLFVFRPENEWFVSGDKKKIQIISTRRESNLPLEFLYDYAAPNADAELCQYAKESLSNGECDKKCGARKGNQNVICPLGFWGLNRVIERHAYDGKRNLEGNTFALTTGASNPRQPLHVLERALFAASGEVDNAKKGTISRIEKLLKTKAKDASYVTAWSQWVTQVKKSPTLLLLLSHTEDDPDFGNMPALQIAKLPRLRVVDIDEKHVRKPLTTARPLVLLIGCKTNAPDNPLHNCVLAFSTYASIVLSTGATVLALQAAQVAMELVNSLSRLPKGQKNSFGEVMLGLRRNLLGKGLPMVLCLSAYGDADWNLQNVSPGTED